MHAVVDTPRDLVVAQAVFHGGFYAILRPRRSAASSSMMTNYKVWSRLVQAHHGDQRVANNALFYVCGAAENNPGTSWDCGIPIRIGG